MTDSEFNTMIERADRKYKFIHIEKIKIRELLEYCHATDMRRTLRRMYEVFFRCDAMPGMEITTGNCNDECARYGCSNCTAADDAELLINQEKTIFDFEPTDEFFFKEEVVSIINKYHGKKNGRMAEAELQQVIQEISQELKCCNMLLGE